jgi:hypothetical protein
MTYFAYVHAKPDTRDALGIFYVGKGKGIRDKDLSVRNRHHGFVLSKHGKENILVGKIECSSESSAFDLERGLIKCLRRMQVNLTNVTDGGEGSSGYKHLDSTKAKLSITAEEVAQRPGVKVARSIASHRSNLERWADPEYKDRVSKAMQGKKKTLSQASLDARSRNSKCGTALSATKKSEAAKKMWTNPEFKAMMSQKRKQSWQDPEKREAMLKGRSEGISKSWKDENVREKRITGIKKSSLR